VKFAYFPGCKIPYHAPQYDRATRAVLDALGIRLADIEFSCCGDPARDSCIEAALLSAARNLALADAAHLPILTPCKCCYGFMTRAAHEMGRNPDLRADIKARLAAEGLAWPRREGRTDHLLTVLDRFVGAETIGRRIIRPLSGFPVAVHYGCRALRPSHIMRFDNPLAPTLFERLVSLTGARPVDWSLRLECCGNPLHGKDDRLSAILMDRKIESARAAGAQALITACTHCHIQFDTVQAERAARDPSKPLLPTLLYPQLLGLAMGMKPVTLGIEINRIQIEKADDDRYGRQDDHVPTR